MNILYSKAPFNQDQASRQEQGILLFVYRNHGGVCRRERGACLFQSKNIFMFDYKYKLCTLLVRDMRFSRLASISLIFRSSSSRTFCTSSSVRQVPSLKIQEKNLSST